MAQKRMTLINPILRFFTWWGMGYTWFAQAIVFWIFLKQDIHLLPETQLLLKGMFAPLLAWGLCSCIKYTVKRPRPIQVLVNYNAIARSPRNESFPSSHAGAAFALVAALYQLEHPLAGISVPWAIIVSFSRFLSGCTFSFRFSSWSMPGIVNRLDPVSTGIIKFYLIQIDLFILSLTIHFSNPRKIAYTSPVSILTH